MIDNYIVFILSHEHMYRVCKNAFPGEVTLWFQIGLTTNLIANKSASKMGFISIEW